MNQYRCIHSFEIDEYDDYESKDPIGVKKIESGSVWTKRENSWEHEVILDNVETGEWLGLTLKTFRNYFYLISTGENING